MVFLNPQEKTLVNADYSKLEERVKLHLKYNAHIRPEALHFNFDPWQVIREQRRIGEILNLREKYDKVLALPTSPTGRNVEK